MLKGQDNSEMGRAPCCDKANVKKGPWSPEEDTKLKAYIDLYGTGGNWIALPQKIGLKRCGKSCRLRWLNYLRPNIKHGEFSEVEDNIISGLYISIGSRWSIIAAQLPGRTDNDIKNYWNTRLKKKLFGRRKQSNRVSSMNQDLKNGEEEIDNPYSHAFSNSAFERLQLHMQLQSIQIPFSPYNSPSIFSNLHPIQENMIQNLPCSNQNPSSLTQHVLQIEPQSLHDQQNAHNFYESSITNQQDYSNPGSNMFVDLKPGNMHDEFIRRFREPSTFLGEVDTYFSNKTASGFVQQYDDNQDQRLEFDCFKDVDGPKDSMIWWPSSNDYDSTSSSVSSWDSTSVLQSEMFQDYALGYNM